MIIIGQRGYIGCFDRAESKGSKVKCRLLFSVACLEISGGSDKLGVYTVVLSVKDKI